MKEQPSSSRARVQLRFASMVTSPPAHPRTSWAGSTCTAGKMPPQWVIAYLGGSLVVNVADQSVFGHVGLSANETSSNKHPPKPEFPPEILQTQVFPCSPECGVTLRRWSGSLHLQTSSARPRHTLWLRRTPRTDARSRWASWISVFVNIE